VFKSINAKQIFSVASDASILCQSIIQQKAGLLGSTPDFIQFFNNKNLYKKQLKNVLPSNAPNLMLCKNKQDVFHFFSNYKQDGIILKPKIGSGSKNVKHIIDVKSIDSLTLQLNLNDYILEEFINGQEFGGDFICFNGKLLFYFPTLKKTNQLNVPISHLVLMSNYNLPKVMEFIQSVISALNLENGVFNVDIILKNKQWFLLDISPRIGGNCIPDVIALSTGINEWKFITEWLLTNNANNLYFKWNKPSGVYILHSMKEGIIVEMVTKNHPFGKAIVSIYWKVKTTTNVQIFDEGSKHLGYVIYQAKTDEELLNLSNKIEKFQWFRLS